MSTTSIEQPNLFCTPPFLKDIVGTGPSFCVGTFNQRPNEHAFDEEALRELFIKTNFQSKGHLYRYGPLCIVEKTPCSHYDWQVIKATAVSLCMFLATNVKTAFFLIALVPVTLKLGTWQCAVYVAATIYGFILPAIQQAQKPYLDKFVAYRNVFQISNSMQGFDLDELANDKSGEVWIDPMTLETIPPNQISSSQILRIGKYAIPIVSALQSMLTRDYQRNDCALGEIPHPIEFRQLNPEEKKKFLREVSAFFAIKDPQRLLACWGVGIESININPYILRVPNWNYLLDEYKVEACTDLAKQILPIQRKYIFLQLLTDSLAQKYFDADFRSKKIMIPIYQFPVQPILQEDLQRGLAALAFENELLVVPEVQEPIILQDLVQLARDQRIPEDLIQQILEAHRPEE
jgi:hypothetical protein